MERLEAFPRDQNACPACGKPAHLGKGRKSHEHYWLHDDVDDYYLHHGDQGEPCFVEPGLAAFLGECGDPDEVPRLIATWKNRPVRCVETGEVFESIEAAADHAGVAAASVSVALKKCSRSGGFHWEYTD